jgi:hypothetical protein
LAADHRCQSFQDDSVVIGDEDVNGLHWPQISRALRNTLIRSHMRKRVYRADVHFRMQ